MSLGFMRAAYHHGMTRAWLGVLCALLVSCGGAPIKTASSTSKPTSSPKPVVAGPERVDASFQMPEPKDGELWGLVLPKPDGRVLVSGPRLIQVLENGQPDPSFTPFEWPNDGKYGGSLRMDPSNRMYVMRSSKSESELLRLQANGTMDLGFGVGGRIRVGFQLNGMVATANGVLLVGSNWLGAQPRLVMARLDWQGRKDRRFAGGGFYAPPWPNSRAEALEVLPNGRFVVAGAVDGAPAMLRFHPDGTLDRSFGRDGVASIGTSPCAELFRFIVPAPDGGWFAAGHLHKHVIARFTRNGRSEPRFAGNGHVCFKYEFSDTSLETNFAEITGLVAQADGSVIASGYALDWVGALRGLIRFDRNGQRDWALNTDRSVVGLALDRQGRALVVNMHGRVERLLAK